MASEALTTLRDHLQDFVHGTTLPSREIVAAFREAHPESVAAASRELEDKALVSVVDEVSRRRARPHVVTEGQADLFGGPVFKHPEAILVEKTVSGQRKRIRQAFDLSTYAQAKAYLTRPARERKPRPDMGALAALEQLRPFFVNGGTTIGEAKAAQAAAAAASAASAMEAR